MLRHAFDEAPSLVDGVAPGDTSHASAVAEHLHLISTALHAHHEGEDSQLWDKMKTRAPACALHVDRMIEQHAAMLIPLDALDAAVPAWRASADPADAVAVHDALRGVARALAEHLPDEEQNLVPVMERVITQKEMDWLAHHGQAATPKGKAWYMLGAILDSHPDKGQAWLEKNMHGVNALAWRFIGAPSYAKYRARLEESTSR
ncbi:hemerythrin domain-containing protein [Microbacterium sp. CH1]|uniref:hemerythrin domain-containing protein n=1 Tax=Microbacterium sp. CH1 TaxID=1770208 RepID=UPI001E31F3E7|nr:hemerythrin domain-containing protein [Microbacterium sp. CH1]